MKDAAERGGAAQYDRLFEWKQREGSNLPDALFKALALVNLPVRGMQNKFGGGPECIAATHVTVLSCVYHCFPCDELKMFSRKTSEPKELVRAGHNGSPSAMTRLGRQQSRSM